VATITVTVSDALGSTATGTTTVTTATASINVGQTTIGPTADNGNGNNIWAQPIVLTQPGTLQSLSFYVRVLGGQLRLGLYSGTTGPSSLLAQTNAFTPSATGWNTQLPTTAPVCVPGNYWLAYEPASNALGFWVLNNAGGPAFGKSITFGAMPTQFPSGATQIQALWSFYATFSVTPDTIPPSIPTNLTATNVS
jgi:hypothetical protein